MINVVQIYGQLHLRNN